MLDDLQSTLPEGMKISRHIFKQADFIEVAVRNVLAALRDGGLLVVLIVVLIAIFGLLIVAFRSAADALIVMINLPLALIGGVAGLYAGGGILAIAGMIGFIALFGIAVRNGILLVSHIRHLKEEEGVADMREAVMRGAIERLAAILMTALTASLALLPLALGTGKPGNEIQALMALVILYGLLSSTFLNMVALPAIYCRFRRSADPQSVGMSGMTSQLPAELPFRPTTAKSPGEDARESV